MSKTKMVYVTRLDGEQEFSIQPKTKGKELLEQVAKAIDLGEIWYFGLQFTDSGGNAEWLNLKKKVLAQDVKNRSPPQLKLRVRFYPEDTERELIQDVTRRLFFLQVKEDVLSGSISCPPDAARVLDSCAEKYEQSCQKEAAIEYLKIAQTLDMFGVTYFKMKGKKEAELWLGVDAAGVKIYPKDDKLTPSSRFLWADIRNVHYKGKILAIKPMERRAPTLKLYAEQSRETNKRVLELVTGNHLLHTRRQEPDSAEVQQLKARARESGVCGRDDQNWG